MAFSKLILIAAAAALCFTSTEARVRHHKHHHAQFKATPWEANPAEKKAKCDDLCTLRGFYSFQQMRNCESRPTDLCMQYKLGLLSMEGVLITSECECEGASDDE
ncbi:TPA: hypothetical protein N0F65_013048 [Lagenidium giganteum]|uniref:Uncharacterized protein n=1 Tax=Lagenidium giganteum TaxID=4803 RepID=A0AAV2YPF2_9STRA|nr:TPA: hypothetical protein N0F65_013048 [Lagenidium giganteum]